MSDLIDLKSHPVSVALNLLLRDRTTEKNIIFATDAYDGVDKTYAAPVYNMFMDEAATIADKAELIHPARFLFNAGATPKAWNEKMLADEHFKVLQYSENAADVFPNTDIKGGLVISYRDATKNYDPIGIFTKYDELNTILHKVKVKNEKSFDTIIA